VVVFEKQFIKSNRLHGVLVVMSDHQQDKLYG